MWILKILLKIVISRLRIPQHVLHNIGIFRHGKMDEVKYAKKVFNKHLQIYIDKKNDLTNKVFLEFGPGDSIASAIFCGGLKIKSILVDNGDFTKFNSNFFISALEESEFSEEQCATLSKIKNKRQILEYCNSNFLSEGIKSLKDIDSNSVDYIWSQAVLEHVNVYEVVDCFNEFFRILKKDGIMSHVIDFKDHLGGNLNNLRFSEKIWESDLFSKSGFYTNRIRFPQMKYFLEENGFETNIKYINKWDELPTRRNLLSKKFSNLNEDDLLINEAHIVCSIKTAL